MAVADNLVALDQSDVSISSEFLSMHDLLETFSIEDTGLAMFDSDFELVYANPVYAQLCGYSLTDLARGRRLPELARMSLERSGALDANWIDETVERSLSDLRQQGKNSFSFSAPSGKRINIRRTMLGDGRLVETVREYSRGAETLEHGHLELMAKTARRRMMHALEGMADGFAYFDEHDRLIIYNRQFIDLNPAIEDIIAPGKSYETLLRTAVERRGYETGGIDPETYISWRMEQHRDPGRAHDLRLQDGRYVRVRERRTSDGGTVKTRSDVTELKRHESELINMSTELRRRNMMFDTALNNMIQGVCMFDQDQRLIVCNRRYLEMYRFSGEVVKPGIQLSDIMEYSISLGNYTRDDARRALEERPDQAKLRERKTIKQFLRDGRVIAVMNEPMPDGGSLATYQDITELENHERERGRYLERLEASNRELQDFAYVASHDLQEPLRKIETFGDRLTSKFGDEIPAGATNYIERMQNATGRMRLLINDLLTYSRVTSEAKPFVEIDMNEQIGYVLSDLSVRIEELDGVVTHDPLPNIEADPVQIRQVLQNLIGNALKFNKPGVAPRVTVSAKVIEGDFTTQRPSICELRIADNGIGFEQKYKDQIFTIFQRLHGRNEYEGTGIGLATVRKIVERHGGTIDAEGESGVGATFIVELPIERFKQQTDSTNSELEGDDNG